MKNLHLIETDRPSDLYLMHNKSQGVMLLKTASVLDGVPQHLYITSSEEIKEGDWFYLDMSHSNTLPDEIHQMGNDKWSKTGGIHFCEGNSWVDSCKKIILTTDQDLIKDGVQAIDDEFLKWFVNNSNCEKVEVKSNWEFLDDDYRHGGKQTLVYKIIIPKEKPDQAIVGYRLNPDIDRSMVDNILKNPMPIWNKKDTSVYFIKGHIAGSLVAKLKELQVLDLWFTPIYEDEEIKSDWVKENHLEYYYKEGVMADKSKQETLEEADKKITSKRISDIQDKIKKLKKEQEELKKKL